ncbi:MAG: cation:proton antiporter [Spirochaetes bacterium]|nr:cation:proton antiporter [Spirochaetota bacterium]
MNADFLFQAFIYLAAAVVSVPIAKRLGLGSVLAYLLAGMILGPDAINLLGERSRDVMKFAEFGVVMMLFLIGLELRPRVVWSLRVPLLGMGGAQVALTSLAAAAGLRLMGWSWQASIAAGLILAMSSTALVLQSLSERKLLKTPGGQASFSVLLFQDLAVIPILALLPLLATLPATASEAHGVARLAAWQQVLAVLAAVVGIIFGGRFLMRPVFRAVARTGLREVFTALALLLVVGIALLMERVGMSPALGAFLAGVVLADNEYRHELEGDIEPFKGLLLAFFFIAVGASVDFGYVRGHPLAILLGVLGVLALKFAVLFAVGRAFRLASGASFLFAGALCQVGEFAFVLLSLAGQQGVFTAEQVRPLTVIVALSMVLTPPLLMLVDRATRRRLDAPGRTRAADAIEAGDAPVLIAGYGRMGRMVGRILRANGVKTAVLELNADQVAHARRVGLEAWYGDASRLDLLAAAGIDRARLLIIAIDDPEVAVKLADAVRLRHPALKLIVRARDHVDAYAFFKRGIEEVHRETFGSALAVGEAALRALGFGALRSHRSILAWRKHNEAALRELARHWGDEKGYFDKLRSTIRDEEGMLAEDGIPDLELDRAWDNAGLREEVKSRAKPPPPA